MLKDAWSGDHMEFQARLLGQSTTGSVDVAYDHVRLEVQLPWVLAMVANRPSPRGAAGTANAVEPKVQALTWATEGSNGFMRQADISQPRNLTEMICLAERLSDGLQFVRVDLYSFGHRVAFGEMTFAPGAGWNPFDPPTYELFLGQHWR